MSGSIESEGYPVIPDTTSRICRRTEASLEAPAAGATGVTAATEGLGETLVEGLTDFDASVEEGAAQSTFGRAATTAPGRLSRTRSTRPAVSSSGALCPEIAAIHFVCLAESVTRSAGESTFLSRT